MIYTVSEIIKQVKIKLDENEVTPSFLETEVNQVQLDSLIKGCIIESVQAIYLQAPTNLLDGTILATTATINQDGSGYIILPDDFLKLIVFKMSSWKKPVNIPISDADPIYQLQHNKFIRGGVSSPICALTTSKDGKILEFFSVDASKTNSVDKALYVAYPKFKTVTSTNDSIEISSKVFSSVIFMCAGMVSDLLKEREQAERLYSLSKLYL